MTGNVFWQDELQLTTSGRGSVDVTSDVAGAVQRSGVRTGVCFLFLKHTSASLMLCENADPGVRSDLETFFSDLVPDGDPRFRHDAEGPDDMPAHIRSVLTSNDLHIPVTGGRLALGTWQGIYLWEHRHRGHRRSLAITIQGSQS